MERLLTSQIVYDYIKMYCYDPVYSVYNIHLDPDTVLSELPYIQFDPETYYVYGSYIIYSGQLYMAIAEGAGPWMGNSIGNTFTGENVYSGEAFTANFNTDGYDDSRFKLIDIEGPLDLLGLKILRTDEVIMGFDNQRAFRNYIRNHGDPKLYDITVTMLDSREGYLAEWDNHQLIFYGVI